MAALQLANGRLQTRALHRHDLFVGRWLWYVVVLNVTSFPIQLARVQQELQQTQDRLANSERGRQSAERQVKDLEVKLEELEAQGGKVLKNQIKKLEQRVRHFVSSFVLSVL